MKKLGLKIALSVGSLALALLGTELALRLEGYDPLGDALDGRVRLVRSSQDPIRGYELVPGAHGQGWGTDVAVNSRGFRGPEVDPATSAGAFIALGDSVTFGNDLAFDETWPAVLASELAASGTPTRVLNLGLGGYDTVQEVATLESLGLAFRPARVIVGFCVNDLGIVSMSMETSFTEADRGNPLFVSRIAQWLHAKAMERAQRRALFERNLEQAYAREHAGEIDAIDPVLRPALEALRADVAAAPTADQDLATRRIPPRWFASERRLGRLQHAFDRLATLAHDHDFEVTVLLIPYLEADALLERGVDLVAAMARSRGFEVVDPRASFAREGLAGLRIRPEDPVHPNARGHLEMARALLAAWSASAPD